MKLSQLLSKLDKKTCDKVLQVVKANPDIECECCIKTLKSLSVLFPNKIHNINNILNHLINIECVDSNARNKIKDKAKNLINELAKALILRNRGN